MFMALGKYSSFSFLRHVLWGQGLVICCTLSSLVSKWIEQVMKEKRKTFPEMADSFIAMQTIALYLSIFLIYYYKKRRKRKAGSEQRQLFTELESRPLRYPSVWLYIVASLADCGATVLIFLAMPYAKAIQISLLEDTSTPIAFLLELGIAFRQNGGGRLYRQSRLEWIMKITGVLMCLASITFYALMQKKAFVPDHGSPWTHFVLGLMLPVGSAACYAVSNILQVKLTSAEKDYNQELVDKFMLRLGLFGTLCSLIFGAWLLPKEFCAILILPLQSLLAIFLIVSGLLAFYLNVPLFLHKTSATFLNMSLMTKNFLIAILEEWWLFVDNTNYSDYGVRWWTWVTLGGILCSLLMFNGSSILASAPIRNDVDNDALELHLIEQAL